MAQVPSTARIRQRRRQRLLVTLALILMAGGAATYYFLRPPPVKDEVRPPGMVAVPAAGVPIPMGTTVTMRQIRLLYMKPMEVPPDALLKPWQFERRVALRAIGAGDYLRDNDLSPVGAPNGFSGLAKPGMRVLVVETVNIRGTLNYLRPGDHIDVLAVGWTGNVTGGSGNAGGLAASTTTVQGGGTHPGDRNAPARRSGSASGTGGGSASLVAEDAIVMMSPRKGRDTEYVVLQMQPTDAHLTALALGAGASLRFVFRPFNETQRVTEPAPVEQTTYPPRDARNVELIEGVARSVQRASMED